MASSISAGGLPGVLRAGARQGVRMGRVLGTVALWVGATLLAAASPAQAQGTLNEAIAARAARTGSDKDQLLLEAKELVYDNDRNTVTAIGDVELNYKGRTLQADRVVYDRAGGRVTAEGNARLTEADGTVVTASRFELTDDFRSGFIDSLRITQKTTDDGRPVTARFSAPRAERAEGETTVFERGTYTACEPCKANPEKPPLWQVKAARIIHNNQERTIYYENATLELAGIPIAYVPYFWSPDPTVRRLSGFLAPTYVASSALGFGVTTPYFFNLAPNYDVTVAPTLLTRQGLLGQAEFRHRVDNGLYNIKATGIAQQDTSAFLDSPLGAGDRQLRGSVESTGLFFINDRWKWGWDATAVSDKWFLSNYKIRPDLDVSSNYFREATSTVFLQGQGDRSFFDARGYYFRALSTYDWQKLQPVVHPVIDYDKRIDGPAPLGGEIAFNANMTSLSRQVTDFSSVDGQLTRFFVTGADGAVFPLFDTCAVFSRETCIVRGIAGTATRASADLSWRREFVDGAGQVWTPFAYLRADAFAVQPDVTGFPNYELVNFIDPENQFVGRVMPAVGLEYRFPFVADTGRGVTQVVEPIAQFIARPNETRIGRLPNEDAQSLVFDDTSIFEWDKFSGYDRVEGGVRANVGAQYSLTADSGLYANMLFGQSIHLAGENSFATGDIAHTGLDSGLETDRSDYVARFHVAPNEVVSFTTRARLNEADLSLKRIETGVRANYGPLTTSFLYAHYDPQPELGIDYPREGFLTALNVKLNQNWFVGGSALVDLDRDSVDRERFIAAYAASPKDAVYAKSAPFTVAGLTLGAGYEDECATFSVLYSSALKDTADGTRQRDQTVLFRIELKTLGQAAVSSSLSSSTTQDGIRQ
jgi:LPS-assembly protein